MELSPKARNSAWETAVWLTQACSLDCRLGGRAPLPGQNTFSVICPPWQLAGRFFPRGDVKTGRTVAWLATLAALEGSTGRDGLWKEPGRTQAFRGWRTQLFFGISVDSEMRRGTCQARLSLRPYEQHILLLNPSMDCDGLVEDAGHNDVRWGLLKANGPDGCCGQPRGRGAAACVGAVGPGCWLMSRGEDAGSPL